MIGYIIGSLCIIILLIGILLFYKIIKNEAYKEYGIYKNEIAAKKEVLLREYNTLEQNINKQTTKNKEMIQREDEMVNTIIAQKQQEIAAAMSKFGNEQSLILEEDFEALKKEKINLYNQYLAGVTSEKQRMLDELENIKQILEDFQAKRAAVNEAMLKEKEIREERDFYRIIISDSDLSDIALLNTIEPQLRNKEALNKLIFEVFYKTPLKAMINRISNGKDISGIYKITNLQTQECYIGKSVHVTPDRWTEHVKTALNIGKIARTRIHDAMRQYGIHNFTFEILEEVEKDKLTEREKFYIELYQSNISGYNMKIG